MSDPTPQTAITKAQESPAARLNAFLRPRMKNIADYARGLVKPETLVKLACFEMTRPESDWITKASFESIYASLIVAAQLGLEPGIRQEAFLVPFKGKCTLMPGYRGLIKLAVRSGMVKSVRARIVYEGDDYVVKLGTEQSIHHEPRLNRQVAEGEAPQIISAYAIAEMVDGSQEFDAMDGWELDKHRAAGNNGPAWKTWPEEMYRKAPVRRLSKYLPLGEDYAKALRIDELHASGQADKIGEVIDLPADAVTEGPAEPQPSAIQRAADKAK